MNHIIQEIENEQLKQNLPDFRIGDTIVVQVEVKEGNRTRSQAFEGVVIAKRNRGLNSSFTVRKISHGEGVERVFQTHSPVVKGIEIKRRGHVRKAKLYHLRGLAGKGARIKERLDLTDTNASNVINANSAGAVNVNNNKSVTKASDESMDSAAASNENE